MLRGFRNELTKKAELDTKGGLQGATLGALIGAVLGGVSPHIIAKMLTRNADLAALLGGLVGAGGGATLGALLGKKVEQQKTAFDLAVGAKGAAKSVKGIGAKVIPTPKPVHAVESGVARASSKVGHKTRPKINVTV